MGQALYRKYRSKSLAEIVGQEHITTALKNALAKGRVSHAYLFTGPRGVGKTSVARILAHEINGLPYTDDESHLDIIEIDAASNRRIDEIRDLRDKVHIAPASAKYKVYIIDEVHMLTKEAFNALLKTLEEPPAHVVFILATTEAHKLPETIISRTQRFSFRPIPTEAAVAHLQQLARQEKIDIDDDALELIAERGEGSLRDSTGLLDQASNTGEKITRQQIEQLLGLAPAQHIARLMAALQPGGKEQGTAIVRCLDELYAQGLEPAMIAMQLGESLRQKLLADGQSTAAALELLRNLLEVAAARQPKQLLELILLQAAMADAPATTRSNPPGEPPEAAKPPAPKKASSPPATAAKQAAEPAESLPAAPAEPAAAPAEEPKETPAKRTASGPLEATALWQQVLDDIKKQHNTLYGIARMAKPTIEGKSLTLGLKFAFHQKRLNEAKNRQLLSDVIEHISGQKLEIHCVIDEAPADDTAVAPNVSTISNIFGGAELLQ
jgi:DNA polymerase-3 subunit gamma/tau